MGAVEADGHVRGYGKTGFVHSSQLFFGRSVQGAPL